MWRVASVLSCALLCLAPTAAAQKQCEAPPGTSAIDQYCETVPTAGGERDTTKPPTQGAGSGGPTTDEGAIRQLEQSGPDGRALAETLRETGAVQGPRGGRDGKGDPVARGDGESGSAGRVAVPSESPVEAVRSAASDGATLGATLPWALLGLTLLLSGLLWIRLRARDPESVD